jgi:hypothetical protein
MILAELIAALQKTSSGRAADGLVDLLQRWRFSADTADALCRSAESYIENAWIERGAEHNAVHSLWTAFRSKCISGRRGMTMNERLHCFDLFGVWDQADSDDARAVVRHKIDFLPEA